MRFRYYAPSLQRLINFLNRLPGIGQKTAQRLALHILKQNNKEVEEFSQAIKEAKEKIIFCSICNNFTESDPCPICNDEERLRSIICVVEEQDDVIAFEKTGVYQGLYHVLGGAISPLEGINPEDLKIKELLKRIQKGGIEEIILATNPNVEGEATALYLARLIKPLGIKVTRLAHGLPVGGDLEFADEVTLSKSLEGRREF